MRRFLVAVLGTVLALLLFWFIDSPSTVRIKAAVVRQLPLPIATINETINSLCVGAHSGRAAGSCYSAFSLQEPDHVIEARVRCASIVNEMRQAKDWLRLEPDSNLNRLRYMYVGNDDAIRNKFGLAMFFPDDCTITGIKDGKATSYGF